MSMFETIPEPILDRERYNQMFTDAPEVEEEPDEDVMRCEFCGRDSELVGLPDGTVVCNYCLTDLEDETEWFGDDEWRREHKC